MRGTWWLGAFLLTAGCGGGDGMGPPPPLSGANWRLTSLPDGFISIDWLQAPTFDPEGIWVDSELDTGGTYVIHDDWRLETEIRSSSGSIERNAAGYDRIGDRLLLHTLLPDRTPDGYVAVWHGVRVMNGNMPTAEVTYTLDLRADGTGHSTFRGQGFDEDHEGTWTLLADESWLRFEHAGGYRDYGVFPGRALGVHTFEPDTF